MVECSCFEGGASNIPAAACKYMLMKIVNATSCSIKSWDGLRLGLAPLQKQDLPQPFSGLRRGAGERQQLNVPCEVRLAGSGLYLLMGK